MSGNDTTPTPAGPDAAATVIVVDDEASVRRSVARLIRSAGLGVRTFASAADFLDQDPPPGPACVVLDVYMDGMTGLEVQDALRRRDARRLPIVFLSGSGTVPTTAACFRGGAEDFLEKPFKAKELLDAVYRALDHDASRANDRADLADMRRRYDDLTPREQEVMTLVVAGLLNKQVAYDLCISEKTVKVHRARVMEKMEVESFAELVLIAQRLGITPGSRHEGADAEADESCLATVG
jgi:FixJ family two-component response regulator